LWGERGNWEGRKGGGGGGKGRGRRVRWKRALTPCALKQGEQRTGWGSKGRKEARGFFFFFWGGEGRKEQGTGKGGKGAEPPRRRESHILGEGGEGKVRGGAEGKKEKEKKKLKRKLINSSCGLGGSEIEERKRN